MRLLLCALALLFALPSAASAAVPQMAYRSAVYVVSYKGREAYDCGGTLVADREVLTAAHCVPAGATETLVYDETGNEAVASVKASSNEDDLALLSLNSSINATPAVLGVTPQIGDEVWVIGAPDGHPFSVSHGIVSRITHEAMKSKGTGSALEERFFTDAHVWFGNSGGGMYDSAGALIGVVTNMDALVGDPKKPDDVTVVLWGIAVGIDSVQAWLHQVGFSA